MVQKRTSAAAWVLGRIERIHLRLFNRPMSADMRRFFDHLGLLINSALIANLFLFITNLFAGRWLGPDQYGRAMLVLSTAQLLVIPMVLGLNTAATKYVASEEDDRPAIVGTTLRLIIFLTSVTTIIALIFREPLARLLQVDETMYTLAIGIAIVLALYQGTEAIVRGLHQFAFFARWQATTSFAVALTFFGLFALGVQNYRSFAIASNTNFVIFVLASLGLLLPMWGRFSGRWVRTLFQYGIYAILGSISGFVLFNVDRLMLNAYLNPAQVGIYAAYISASTTLPNQALQIFLNVFFPTVAKLSDQRSVARKLVIIGLWSFLPLMIVSSLTTFGVMWLFGDQYPLRLSYVLLFSFNAALYILGNVLWWLIASRDVRGIRFTSIHSIISATINLGLNVFLISRWGILGAVIANVTASAYVYLLGRIYIAWYLPSKSTEDQPYA